MKLSYQPYRLKFKKPGGTSRGVLFEKLTYLIRLQLFDGSETEFFGESGLFKGLSAEDHPGYEQKLIAACEIFNESGSIDLKKLNEFPSIQFGVEQILKQLKNFQGKKTDDDFNPILFPSKFTEGKDGIKINGLIWMGEVDFMKSQIKEKLKQNFTCLKLKIGVNWNEEKEILKSLRNEFSESELELRVDANGGFSFEQSQTVLNELAELKIHSIEQPIKAGQVQETAKLCETTPTPIALDEELIGVFYPEEKKKLLEAIKPQYIILKPSLIGGWQGSEEWISVAERQNTGWGITSALESNIGLNAIAQWAYTLNNPMPQGLGTGSLFENNFHSRLKLQNDQLYFL